jgi:hypothetical protein
MAAVVCGLASSASSARLLTFDDPISPPSSYLNRGLDRYAAGVIRVQQDTIERVNTLCGAAHHYTGGGTITACSLGDPDPSFPFYLVIIVGQEYVDPAWWTDTFNHELAHIGGWPANHP